MADEIDLQQENETLLLEAKLRQRKPEPAPPTGLCFNCEEKLESSDRPRRFCDSDCRDDYEQRLRFNALAES